MTQQLLLAGCIVILVIALWRIFTIKSPCHGKKRVKFADPVVIVEPPVIVEPQVVVEPQVEEIPKLTPINQAPILSMIENPRMNEDKELINYTIPISRVDVTLQEFENTLRDQGLCNPGIHHVNSSSCNMYRKTSENQQVCPANMVPNLFTNTCEYPGYYSAGMLE